MALTKCKECKKEVSTSAKVCPHCGVKNPGTTAGQAIGGFVVLVLLVWGAIKIFGGSDDNKPAAKADTPKNCAANDGQCLFDKNWIEAASRCRPLIEKSSKYDFEWTDGMMTPMFSHFRLNEAKKQMTFIGDKVKFTNGFNAKITMTYNCPYDLQGKSIVDFGITEGKL